MTLSLKNSPGTETNRRLGVRNVLVVALAFTSGATDAIGFLALGSAFTSVMTGNMVLTGIAAARTDLSALALTTTAIASFVFGAAIGARVAGTARPGDPCWPSAVTTALTVELALLGLFAIFWWTQSAAPPKVWFLPLLALNATALGLQSSAIQRFGVSGLSTTYLTGTLTSVVIRVVSGKGFRDVNHSLWILFGLVAGAALGAVLVRQAPVAVPLAQLAPLLSVVCVARFSALRAPS